MNRSTKMMIAGIAAASLLTGAAARVQAASTPSNNTPSVSKAGSQLADSNSDTHSCKGQNSCKGKGGCKTSDNGCKGKNTCKGKGGCKSSS